VTSRIDEEEAPASLSRLRPHSEERRGRGVVTVRLSTDNRDPSSDNISGSSDNGRWSHEALESVV
jgi:hypothetical protein